MTSMAFLNAVRSAVCGKLVRKPVAAGIRLDQNRDVCLTRAFIEYRFRSVAGFGLIRLIYHESTHSRILHHYPDGMRNNLWKSPPELTQGMPPGLCRSSDV